MKRLFTPVVLLLVCAGVPASAIPPVQEPARLDLTILHDNDLHGHLLSFPYLEKERGPKESPIRGGAARRATLVKRLRAQIKNPLMLIDSGDTTTRGPLATTYEGLADIDAMNAIGYDLGALGNNEFKLKDGREAENAAGAQAALLRFIKRSRFSWICANATDARGAFLEGVQPFVVRRVGGVRVGFLGLTAPRSATYPQVKGWTISDPLAVAKEWIPRAREQCDILIAVTHIGTALDTLLAARTQGLDAIIGGDSHTFLYRAVEIPNLSGRRVPIVQAGEFGVDLGRLDLHFARDAGGSWSLAAYEYRLIPIGPELAEDPEIRQQLEPYLRPMQTVVGRLANVGADLAARRQNTTRVVVDAMREAAHADLALNPSGSGFFETFRRSSVTAYDVYSVLPFEDNIATAELSGAEILPLLTASKSTVTSPPSMALNPQSRYRVAFVDYEATAAYRLAPGRLSDTGVDVREAVIQFLQHRQSRTKDSGLRLTTSTAAR